MDLETRVENLENLVNGLLTMINGNKTYLDSDMTDIRNVNNAQSENIDENSYAIFDIAEIIESLDERVTALEGGSDG